MLTFSASSARSFVAFLRLPPVTPASFRRCVIDRPMDPQHPTSTRYMEVFQLASLRVLCHFAPVGSLDPLQREAQNPRWRTRPLCQSREVCSSVLTWDTELPVEVDPYFPLLVLVKLVWLTWCAGDLPWGCCRVRSPPHRQTPSEGSEGRGECRRSSGWGSWACGMFHRSAQLRYWLATPSPAVQLPCHLCPISFLSLRLALDLARIPPVSWSCPCLAFLVLQPRSPLAI